MLIKGQNVWGRAGGIEAQRGDLWVLNLEQVANAVRQHGTFNSNALPLSSQLLIPEKGETIYYAKSIAMPEQRISEIEVKALNWPKLYPGFDEPIGAVRVDFNVDAAITKMNAGTGELDVSSLITRSEIYSLLYAWRILTRIGRGRFSSENIAVPLPGLRINSSLGKSFKFDVQLFFLRGSIEGVRETLDPANDGKLEVSSAYILKRCWISSLQLNNIDQSSSNSAVTLTAALIPEEICPQSNINGGIIDRGVVTPIVRDPSGLA